MLGNQIRSRVSSFIRQQTRGGTKFTAFLGRKMLRNLVVCYSIATELKPKCPTCTQLMSFLALRTFCFESQCFVDWKPRKERTLPSSSFIGLRVKFFEKSVKRQAHYDSILDYCASILDTRCMRVSRIKDRVEDRDSKETVNLQSTFERYCTVLH